MLRYSTIYLFKRVLTQVRPFWPHLSGLFLLNLLATPIALLKPLPLKILIDTGFGDTPMPGYILFFTGNGLSSSFTAVALTVAILVILIALLDNLQMYISWVLHAFTGEKIVLGFRSLLFDHIQRLSIAWHDRRGSSDALYRLQYDTPAIRTLLVGGLSPMIAAFLGLSGMVIVIMLINWKFGLIAIGIIPPVVFLMRNTASRLKKEWTEVKEQESNAMSVVHQVLGALRVVKVFGQEAGEGERFLSRAGKAVDGQVKVARTSAGFYFLSGLLLALCTALFLYFGAVDVHNGTMTLGELTVIIAYLAQLLSPLEKITKTFTDIQSSLASIDRAYVLLDREKEVPEAEYPVAISKAKGAVRFSHVYFSYGDRIALHDITFELQPGQRMGIMGTTGAGKSTLINLLSRFYDPTSGNVYVDDVDIKNYKLADYRKQFSVVLQEPVLFPTTIAENIAYGKPGADRKEIIEAAKLANAHEFIIQLPEGYDTPAGERGAQLSGGERQRIAIARAFIKDAPVLILDEPTSSVDIKTEARIMEAMERLMEGRTTFLVTHRLDTLNSCNVLLHLEKGSIKTVTYDHQPELIETLKKELLNI